MLIRIQIRKLSQLCDVLRSKKGIKFLESAPSKLSYWKEREGTSKEVAYWDNVLEFSEPFLVRLRDLKQLQAFKKSQDLELRGIAEADNEVLEGELNGSAEKLARVIIPLSRYDNLNKCQLEFSAGVGGTEAMLFTGELISMYEKLASQLGLHWSPLQLDCIPLGGIRSAVIMLSGKNAYQTFRFEAGVHRVQRMPVTGFKERMHTSTASVMVLPEPDEVETYVSSKDVKIEAMRAAGPGGQNVNKRSSAVRITHKATGISVHCMEERFQHLNLQIAFRRLAAILMQQQQDSIYETLSSTRKIQMGSRARAEKVRTYNFKDDRITDHRLQETVNNVDEFMNAGISLIRFTEELNKMFLREQLEAFLDEKEKECAQ